MAREYYVQSVDNNTLKGPYASIGKARKALMDISNGDGYLGKVLVRVKQEHPWKDKGSIFRIRKGDRGYRGLPAGTYLWSTDGYLNGKVLSRDIVYILNRDGTLGDCLGDLARPNTRVTNRAGKTIYDPIEYWKSAI